MSEQEVVKHRTKVLKIIGEAIPRSKTRDELQATMEALCAQAGCIFAAFHRIPYDAPGRPSELAQAVRDGLDKWKEQWDQRQ